MMMAKREGTTEEWVAVKNNDWKRKISRKIC